MDVQDSTTLCQRDYYAVISLDCVQLEAGMVCVEWTWYQIADATLTGVDVELIVWSRMH
eukprot:c42402_g1_i1 orf=67-243(+)